MGELHQKSPDLSGPYGRYVCITKTYQIPGGVARLYGERHTTKYRDFTSPYQAISQQGISDSKIQKQQNC